MQLCLLMVLVAVVMVVDPVAILVTIAAMKRAVMPSVAALAVEQMATAEEWGTAVQVLAATMPRPMMASTHDLASLKQCNASSLISPCRIVLLMGCKLIAVIFAFRRS